MHNNTSSSNSVDNDSLASNQHQQQQQQQQQSQQRIHMNNNHNNSSNTSTSTTTNNGHSSSTQRIRFQFPNNPSNSNTSHVNVSVNNDGGLFQNHRIPIMNSNMNQHHQQQQQLQYPHQRIRIRNPHSGTFIRSNSSNSNSNNNRMNRNGRPSIVINGVPMEPSMMIHSNTNPNTNDSNVTNVAHLSNENVQISMSRNDESSTISIPIQMNGAVRVGGNGNNINHNEIRFIHRSNDTATTSTSTSTDENNNQQPNQNQNDPFDNNSNDDVNEIDENGMLPLLSNIQEQLDNERSTTSNATANNNNDANNNRNENNDPLFNPTNTTPDAATATATTATRPNPNPASQQATTTATTQHQSHPLRRVMFHIPPPQPLPQINITLNELKEQPFLPTPQQLQEQHENANASSNNVSSSFPSEFECTICCEVMTQPITCGSCDGRFCQLCLYKTSSSHHHQQQQQQQNQTNENHDIIPCPYCRKPNTISNYKHDRNLLQKIRNSTICKPCINQPFGCNVVCNPISIGLHEQTCLFKPYKCKYHVYGCTFEGTKQDLKHHYEYGMTYYKDLNSSSTTSSNEQHHQPLQRKRKQCSNSRNRSSSSNENNDNIIEPCFYIKLESLFHQQRIQNLQYQHLQPILQNRFFHERSILMNTTQQIVATQMKTVHNLIDVFECVYTCTCLPIHFIWRSLIFKSFWNCVNNRAVMDNILVLVGLIGWVVRIGSMGMGLCWDLIGRWDERMKSGSSMGSFSNSSSTNDGGRNGVRGYKMCHEDGQCYEIVDIDTDDDLVVPIIMLCLCTVLLCIMFLWSFHIDRRSPMQWMMTPVKINYRFIKIETKPLPIIECIQIVLSIMIHFLCIDMENSDLRGKYNIKGLIKLFCLVYTTTCFPKIVAHLLTWTWNLNQQRPHSFDHVHTGRALELIQVGIKYGVLIYYFNIEHVIFGTWLHYNIWFGQSYNGESVSEQKLKRQMFGDSLLHMISKILGNDALDQDDAKNDALDKKRYAYLAIIFVFWNLNLFLEQRYTKLIDQVLFFVGQSTKLIDQVGNQLFIFALMFLIQVIFILSSEVGAIVGNFLVRTLNEFASNNIVAQQRLIVGSVSFFLWMCTMGVVVLL